MPAIEIKIPRGIFFSGIAQLSAELANVVVAPVGVGGADHGRAKARKKKMRKMERAGRKRKSQGRVEMGNSAANQPEHRADHADPQQHGYFSNGGDAPVQQDHQQHDHCAGDGLLLVRGKGMQVAGVLRKSDGARRDYEWRLNQCLPHDEKRHQAAPPAGTVSFTQKNITAAGAWQRGAQFRPHKSIEKREDRSGGPREQGLRPAHRANHQRTHHEGPDADHVDHVESDGFLEAQAALEPGIMRIWLGRTGKLR